MASLLNRAYVSSSVARTSVDKAVVEMLVGTGSTGHDLDSCCSMREFSTDDFT